MTITSKINSEIKKNVSGCIDEPILWIDSIEQFDEVFKKTMKLAAKHGSYISMRYLFDKLKHFYEYSLVKCGCFLQSIVDSIIEHETNYEYIAIRPYDNDAVHVIEAMLICNTVKLTKNHVKGFKKMRYTTFNKTLWTAQSQSGIDFRNHCEELGLTKSDFDI
jgi:hypothetical protein